MTVSNFKDLLAHKGHELVCVTYLYPDGVVASVAIKCLDCNEVLVGYYNSQR